MEDQSVTQAELAKRMGCTQQYVSNLLKGSSNMTLETIARLENALNIDILYPRNASTNSPLLSPVFSLQMIAESTGFPIAKNFATKNFAMAN